MVIKRNEIRWLLLIVVIAVLARALFFLILVPWQPQLENRDYWILIARNVVVGNGYIDFYEPTAKRGPVGVYFFVALLHLFGDHTMPILFGQWFVEAGTCVLVYLIAREIFDDERVALLSSLMYALYGPAIFYSVQALSEPIFTLLLAGFTLSFLRTLRSPSVLGFAFAGVLLGLTTLVRPAPQLYLLFALGVMVWALRRQWRGLFYGLIALSTSFLLVMTPWVVRNYAISGRFILASSLGGISLFQGNYRLGKPDFLRPYNYSDSNEESLIPILMDRFGSGEGVWGTAANEYEADLTAQDEAIKLIRAHPVRYVVSSIWRIYKFWFHMKDGSFDTEFYLVLAANVSLLLLAAAAFVFYRGPWCRRAVPVIVFLAYYTAVHMAIIAQTRNSVPIAPYVMMFAAHTVVSALCHIPRTRQALDRL